MAELAEQRLKAFQEEFGLIRTRGKGQGMHIAKTKADKAPGQLLSHACLCPALPEGGSHPHAVGQKNAQQQARFTKSPTSNCLSLHPAGACNVGPMHSLMFHRYQKLPLVCGSEGVLVWRFAGYRKVPKPLASVPKKSVVKLKRDTANKAGSMKKQVLCMQRQCLKSSARLSACYLLLCRSIPCLALLLMPRML